MLPLKGYPKLLGVLGEKEAHLGNQMACAGLDWGLVTAGSHSLAGGFAVWPGATQLPSLGYNSFIS